LLPALKWVRACAKPCGLRLREHLQHSLRLAVRVGVRALALHLSKSLHPLMQAFCIHL
jgi:hypothetical protein